MRLFDTLNDRAEASELFGRGLMPRAQLVDFAAQYWPPAATPRKIAQPRWGNLGPADHERLRALGYVD